MRLTFCLCDDENLEECFNEQFHIYCSNELLKLLKLNNGENATVQYKPEDNELTRYVYCCFKNYAELKIKKKLDCYSVYTVASVLKSLGIDINSDSICPDATNENQSNKKTNVSLNVAIKKGEIFIPLKEVELHILETFYEYTIEMCREHYKTVPSYRAINLWDNMKNKNVETYLNLCLLNVCLFENNVIKLTILGVGMYLVVERICFRSKKENNKLISENVGIPYVAHNTKIILKDKPRGKELGHQKKKEKKKKNEEDKEEEEEEEETSAELIELGSTEKETPRYRIKEKKGLKKIGGYKQMKDDIYYYVLLPLIYKRLYDMFQIDINRGILLHGPPGCGKTFVALAIKEELAILQKRIDRLKSENALGCIEQEKKGNEPKLKGELKGEHEQILKLIEQRDVDIKLPEMEIIKSTDLIDKSNSGDKINELFNRCCKRYTEEKRCSIIFIDEIEILCEKRENVNMNLYTTTLLNNMDGVKKNTHTILIGATNFINKIDLALRRSGRFDREIEVSVPNLKDRIEIFKKKLSNVTHNLPLKKIKYIADMCQSFTCSDITALINSAIYNCLREHNVINNNLLKGGSWKKKRNEKTKILEKIKEEEQNLKKPEKKNTTRAAQNSSVILTYRHIMKAMQLIKPSGMKELYVDIPQTKIKNIGGYKFVKKCIKECLIYPKKFKKIYQQYNIQSPKGILLYGPPGCSKTLFAKAIASEINMNFISVKGPEIFSKYVGESEKTIRYIFKKARENNPCVIFFDEIDSIAMNRNLNQNFVSNRVLCQLLNEIDGIYSRLNVVILAATNRPDLIDPALLRPGRFDRIIYVPLPNYRSRVSIFRKTLKFYKMNHLLNINENEVSHVKDVKAEDEKNRNQLEHTNEKRYFEPQLTEEKHLKIYGAKENTICENSNFTKNSSGYTPLKEKEFLEIKEKICLTESLKKENEKQREGLDFIELCKFLAQRTKKHSGAEIVNLCREASICALRETLTAAKKEKKEKGNIGNETNTSDDMLSPTYLTPLSKRHFIKVLSRMKPQTPDYLIHFYKQYNSLK